MKCQGITRVIATPKRHFTKNINMLVAVEEKFWNANSKMFSQNFIEVHPLWSCWDISVWTKVLVTGRLTAISRAMPRAWLKTTFTITPSSTSQISWGSSSNAGSQINRFISFIWKGLGSCLSPSPRLPGVYWWGLFAGVYSLCSSICWSARWWMDERPIRFKVPILVALSGPLSVNPLDGLNV